MATPHPLDYTELCMLLSYDPESGTITWKARLPEQFSDSLYSAERKCSQWNTRYAGKKAGSFDESTGYLVIRLGGKSFKSHRVAWCLFYGEDVDGVIDHVDGDKLNNKIKNLRSTSLNGNARNTTRRRSGEAGVVWYEKNKKWRAQIWSNGKNICLGYFDNKEDAFEARKQGEINIWGPENVW